MLGDSNHALIFSIFIILLISILAGCVDDTGVIYSSVILAPPWESNIYVSTENQDFYMNISRAKMTVILENSSMVLYLNKTSDQPASYMYLSGEYLILLKKPVPERKYHFRLDVLFIMSNSSQFMNINSRISGYFYLPRNRIDIVLYVEENEGCTVSLDDEHRDVGITLKNHYYTVNLRLVVKGGYVD